MLETLFSVIFYLFVITLIAAVVTFVAKPPRLLVLPLSYLFFTFSLYLATLFLPNPFLALVFSIMLCLAVSVLCRREFARKQREKLPLRLIGIAMLVSFVLLLTRSSLILSAINPETIYFPLLTDETKHIAVLTSVIASTTSLSFPYNPQQAFPYYYLYYLVAALPLKLFVHTHYGLVWVAHIFLTQFAFYLTVIFVVSQISKKFFLQLLGLLLVMFGTSLKLIPKLFQWYNNTETHIEHWYMVPAEKLYNQHFMTGWQIQHPMTFTIWVPQHEFAAMGLLLLYVFLFHSGINRVSLFLIVMLLTVIFGSSAFFGLGAIGLLILSALLHWKQKKQLVSLFLATVVFALLILPLFLLLRNNQAHIIWQPYLPTLPYLPSFLGTPMFYLMETGIIIPLLAFLSYLLFKQKPKHTFLLFVVLCLITFAPLLVSRLFQSDFNNDFGLRIPIIVMRPKSWTPG